MKAPILDAAALRRAFDETFAAAPATAPPSIDLLLVRIGGDPWAIAMSSVGAVHLCPPIVAVPSASAELAGLVAVRGALFPLYDLRVVLGGPRGPAGRWLVVTGAPPLALALDAVESTARVPARSLLPAVPGEHRGPSAGLVPLDGRRIPVLDLGAVHEDLARKARSTPREEPR